MFGYIYEATNLINNKKYIGKHKAKEFDTNYYGSGTGILKAINKYGKENFKVTILEEIDTNQEDLDLRETYYIEKYNAVKDRNYYNASYGGENEGWTGVNKAVKENPKLNGMYGKRHTKESKLKMSKNTISWNKGTVGLYSKEYRNKISKALSKANSGMIWINKDNKESHIRPEELDLYLQQGWVRGRIISQNISEQNRGRKWMTNDKVNRFVTEEQQKELLEHNYRYGYNSKLRKKEI